MIIENRIGIIFCFQQKYEFKKYKKDCKIERSTKYLEFPRFGLTEPPTPIPNLTSVKFPMYLIQARDQLCLSQRQLQRCSRQSILHEESFVTETDSIWHHCC